MEGFLSEEVTVHCGVPQGSLLGPLFFMHFINDLSNCIMSKCFGNAVDLKIVSDSSVTLQIDAARLWKWSNENFMQLNLPKCSLMVFNGDASVRIGVVEVEERALQQDFGLIVHIFLTWNSQAEIRCGKAFKAFHLIRHNICYSADSYTR